jgi:hypothetical protein
MSDDFLKILFEKKEDDNKYKIFKFTVFAVVETKHAECMQMKQFILANNGNKLDYKNVKCTSPDKYYDHESPDNLLNDNDNKFCDISNTSPQIFSNKTIIIEFTEPVIANQFTYETSFDCPERDPTIWILEGSNDNTHWIKLHEQITPYIPTIERNTIQPWFNFNILNKKYKEEIDTEIKKEIKEESIIPYVKIIYDEKWVEETYKDFLNWLKTQIKNEIHASELLKIHVIPKEYNNILIINHTGYINYYIDNAARTHEDPISEGFHNSITHDYDDKNSKQLAVLWKGGDIRKIINPNLYYYLKKRNIIVFKINGMRGGNDYVWRYEP